MTTLPNTGEDASILRRSAYDQYDDNSDSDDDKEYMVYGDMELFFQAIGEPQLIELFLKNKITLGQLLEFDEKDLIDCGVELVGDRKKILASIGQMHTEKWSPSSLEDMTERSLLSSPGIYVALNDINKHLEYIGVTMKFLRSRLKKRPEILELGKDYVGITKISNELDDMLITSKSTHTQIHALKHEIEKHLSNPLYKPANHIDINYVRVAKIRQATLPVLLATMAIAFSLKFLKFIL